MKLLITFRQPGKGFYKMYLEPKAVLRFINGRARREPASKDGISNSVPIKYITSIRAVGVDEPTCPACKKITDKLVCFDCISKLAQESK